MIFNIFDWNNDRLYLSAYINYILLYTNSYENWMGVKIICDVYWIQIIDI